MLPVAEQDCLDQHSRCCSLGTGAVTRSQYIEFAYVCMNTEQKPELRLYYKQILQATFNTLDCLIIKRVMR
eukprot:4392-Heterococcus_DN1.PRE.6